ncbi:hypothetical protein F7725_020540 [Dissostichus mawsoni]|uniref:Uncharacterized protein n=1 Tax=Dissostichus mawsoni TaxID=36200 RepID=A0A7J5YDH7_DISMA|nr:hypothetical protein F7725_020540 [Dissostichus mawsoni]
MASCDAGDMDSVPAINALAWYYEKFNQDYEQAVKLWEQADEFGSPDAALNLAVMHSQGLYPGKAADQREGTSGEQFNSLATGPLGYQAKSTDVHQMLFC